MGCVIAAFLLGASGEVPVLQGGALSERLDTDSLAGLAPSAPPCFRFSSSGSQGKGSDYRKGDPGPVLTRSHGERQGDE